MIYFASDLWILGGFDKLPDMPQPVALEYPILRLTRNGNAMKLPTIVVSLALGLPLLMIATAPRALALASSESAANPWMFAVSYTHLDVYKRQRPSGLISKLPSALCVGKSPKRSGWPPAVATRNRLCFPAESTLW